MEIKFKNNPITIKTVEIDGKKLTKQFLQQVPLKHYVLRKTDNNKPVEIGYIFDFEREGFIDYVFKGELIGWINVHFEKEEFIANWVQSSTRRGKVEDSKTYSVIFINDKGELNRSYIHINVYNKLFGDKYPQIFI